jgi:hypothetical protein
MEFTDEEKDIIVKLIKEKMQRGTDIETLIVTTEEVKEILAKPVEYNWRVLYKPYNFVDMENSKFYVEDSPETDCIIIKKISEGQHIDSAEAFLIISSEFIYYNSLELRNVRLREDEDESQV